MPIMDLTPTIVLKLALAAALGGLVGLERELRGKPAGLRTNMFICVGSALFTILSEALAARVGGDATRIASQLIPGIGFIGAGSIIRARGSVMGLTTAATIFVMASIGMAVGGGMFWTGVFMAVLILLALSVLGWLERRMHLKTELRIYRVLGQTAEGVLNPLSQVARARDLALHNLTCRRRDDLYEVEFELDAATNVHQGLFQELNALNVRCEIVQLPYGEREESGRLL
ncbi:MAG: MgtC/SapB family protein [Acidobacteria bacterium]|nr:MgtC/SapB family protein [Acidobacteriota bacterium]